MKTREEYAAPPPTAARRSRRQTRCRAPRAVGSGYEPPRLVLYGPLRELTLGGSPGAGDSGGGFPPQRMKM